MMIDGWIHLWKKSPLASDYHPLNNKFKPPPNSKCLYFNVRVIFLPPPHGISNPKTFIFPYNKTYWVISSALIQSGKCADGDIEGERM